MTITGIKETRSSDFYKSGQFTDPIDTSYTASGTVYINGNHQPLAIFSREKKTTYTSLEVQKTWDDYDNATGQRPGEVTVDLYWYDEKDPNTKNL